MLITFQLSSTPLAKQIYIETDQQKAFSGIVRKPADFISRASCEFIKFQN